MSLKNVIHYGLIAVVTVVVSGLTLCAIKLNEYEVINMQSRKANELSFLAKSIYADGLQMGQATRNIILDPTNAKPIKNYEESKGSFGANFEKFKSLSFSIFPNDIDFQKKSETIFKLFQTNVQIEHELHESARAGKQPEAISRLNSEQTPLWREERALILDVTSKATDFAGVLNAKADQAAIAMRRYMFVIGFFMMLIPIAIAFQSARLLALLRKQIERLVSTVQTTNQMSERLSETSETLSNNLNEQASALQETSSSANEISAMVDKNTESSKKASDVAGQSQRGAQEGKQAVEEMVVAIQVIRQSEETLVGEVKASNEEISGIIQMINEIAEKTKVINDIVFQTKLLSFNASVEAARAGEQGRGFAVVAEEVGNLAKMSGTAAKEITDLLSRSTTQVEEIIQKSKLKLETMLVSCSEKSEQGFKTAKQCASALDIIVQNVSLMHTMIEEIKVSSAEQATGVSQITVAIHQMNQVTQKNSASMTDASNTAGQLKSEASEVRDVAQQVEYLLDGVKSSSHAKSKAA